VKKEKPGFDRHGALLLRKQHTFLIPSLFVGQVICVPGKNILFTGCVIKI
jgi:hypothetical protein